MYYNQVEFFSMSCFATNCVGTLTRAASSNAGARTNSPALGWRHVTDAGLELGALSDC